MMRWCTGTVTKVKAVWPEAEIVAVRTENGEVAEAFHDVQVQGRLHPGDVVMLNTTAASLRLGTGGYHFVSALLARAEHVDNTDHTEDRGMGSEHGDRDRSGIIRGGSRDRSGQTMAPGHMMKMRYTPFQRAVLAAEEPDSPHHDKFAADNGLDGMPVLIGELHSMLPATLCWLRYLGAGAAGGKHIRIAYMMSDGGALPIAISRHVRTLNEQRWLCGTITYGHAYGGDLETINKFTALQAARHILQADLAVVTMGPGVAGTSTPYGHTSMETGELVNAVSALGGQPIIIPRLGFADRRERHQGLSHHLLHALSIAAARPAVVPLPQSIPAACQSQIHRQIRDHSLASIHDWRWIDGIQLSLVEESLSSYPDSITTMGRSMKDDPYFFAAAAAAAQYVWDERLFASR